MKRNFAVLLLLTLACNRPTEPTHQTPVSAKPKTRATTDTPVPAKKATKPTPKKAPSNTAVPTYDEELAALTRSIENLEQRAKDYPKQWLHIQRLAGKYSTRARLTGDYDDYEKAEEALKRAFKAAPKGSGPFVARAQLNYTLHRLARIEADLDAADKKIVKNNTEQATLAGMRANLAFQRGQYDAALAGYTKAVKLDRSPTNLSQLALFHWKTGNFDEAEKLYTEAQSLYKGNNPEPRAWLHLQLGLMDLDRGRYEDALAHYQTAGQLMPGYWLIDEHIAEIKTLTGHVDEAKKLYEAIVARTGNPEFIDALAGIHHEAGNQAKADELIAKARAIYEKQLKQFPEAAAGHALEHFLEFGEDAKRTVALAEANHKTRPNAQAKILLAQAYLAAKRPQDALKVIEQALASRWRSADLHDTAADVYTAVGDTTKATKQRSLARAINPQQPA